VKRSSITVRKALCGTAVGILALAGCGGDRSPSTDSPTSVSSDRRMRAFLEQIAERTDVENPFIGEAPVLQAEAELARIPPSDVVARIRVLVAAGNGRLRMGDTREAIAHFEAAVQLLPEASGIEPVHADLTRFSLGLAYLRLGETENCCLRHSAESCIVPIRGGGLHTEREGSSKAIEVFEDLLNRHPDGRIASRTEWLLNIAAMTLGEYPNGVSPAHRIPLETFQSSVKFPPFRNVAPKIGVDTFDLAGGVCIEDFDGDGWLDILTSSWDPTEPMHFYRAARDGSFEDRSQEAGLDGLFGGLNLLHADYDNDGDLDVYVLRGAWLGRAGRHPNSLLRNDGGRFVDVTFDVGLGDVHYPTQAGSWADYDLDGDVDLYVGNESSDDVDSSLLTETGYEETTGVRAPGQLFRNDGARFVDVAAAAGVENLRFAKAASWGDFDGDRYPDLFVSNYGTANRLYHNRGDGTFEDVATAVGVDEPLLSFPAWFWDYDNDGRLDLFVSSYGGTAEILAAKARGQNPEYEAARLYRGDGERFENVAPNVDLTQPMLPMGSNFGDIDGDGFLDFYLGTGSPSYANLLPNQMYLNRRGMHFDDVTMVGGFGHLQKGHAVAFADLDNDGDVDVFEQLGGAYPGDKYGDALFENPGFHRHWLSVRLEGTTSNRAAIGARMRVVVRDGRGDPSGDGERSIYRTVSGGGSFGANPLRQTFGLDDADEVIRVEIFWPVTGDTQIVRGVPVDSFVRVVEGAEGFEVVELPAVALKARS
jgi:hypothetical protein